MLISAADIYLILCSQQMKWEKWVLQLLSLLLLFWSVTDFFYDLKQNLIFEMVKPSFTNKLLSRHHCHRFPQCQEEWLQKWSSWWSLRLRVCNKQPEHHSRLLILSSLHLRPWGDNTATNILLAIWYFSDSETWKRYSYTFAVLWSSSFCFKQISSLHYGKKYWMDVPPYCGIKIKPHLFHKNESPW